MRFSASSRFFCLLVDMQPDFVAVCAHQCAVSPHGGGALRLSREVGAPPPMQGDGLRQASMRQVPGPRLLIGNDYRAATLTDQLTLAPFLTDPTAPCDHVRHLFICNPFCESL